MKTHIELISALTAAALIGLAGCHSSRTTQVGTSSPSDAVTTPSARASTASTGVKRSPLSAAELQQVHPNEVGVVPILEYHDVLPREARWSRSIPNFRHDLARLYAEGYRPVALEDYLSDQIDLPAGKSPVIFTFDDARESQCRYLPDGTLDPNCAVGILKEFHAQHPDFAAKATLFVLPQSAFGQPKCAKRKFQELLAEGFEIQNHTINHPALRTLSDAQVQHEIAGCVTLIHQMVPEDKVDTLALPFGSIPKNRKLMQSGQSEGQTYTNRAALLVGSDPAPSPVSTAFKPLLLPRIQAIEGPSGITYWLDIMKHARNHPRSRYSPYISDGDPSTVTVPTNLANRVDTSRLNGATLIRY